MPDLVGQQLGTYRLIRSIGQGGFADVYLGEHIHLGTYAAVKVLKAQVASGDVELFRNEARIIANLENPHIVRVLDFDVQNGTPFLVMQYAPHGTLRQQYPRGTLLPPATIVPYVKQVAEALQYAHDHKLIHRDVKAENMLLGSNNQVWLSDFGIALIAQSTQASVKETAGTYSYMAPEQVQGHPCAASDQYALGIVVYEWLCGSPPFQGTLAELAVQHMHAPPPPLRQKVPTISPAIELVVLKALAKDPRQRYARVTDFATDLERASQEMMVPPLKRGLYLGGLPDLERASQETMFSPPPPSTVGTALVGPFGRIALGSTVVRIGRTPDNQLVVNDPQVSKQHAEVRLQGQEHAIIDLGSTNGTFVDGQRLPAHVARLLNAGNTIRVGNTLFTYEMAGGPLIRLTAPVPPPPPFPIKPGPPPQLLPQSPKKPRSAVGRVPIYRARALICIAIVLLIAAIAIAVGVNNSLTSAANATATATAQATNTVATTQAHNAATATAVAVPTIQAMATTMAAQNLYTSATSGTPVLTDPLSDNSQNNQWATGSNCQFTTGAYHVNESQKDYLVACPAGTPDFDNFAYQVQMTIVQGDKGCIVFRYTTPNNGSYYAFCIGMDSSYTVIVTDKNGNNYSTLQTGSSSAIISGLNQANMVMVIARGSEFDMYVNGHYILTVTDSTYSHGSVGVGALDDTNATEVACSNAKVWKL